MRLLLPLCAASEVPIVVAGGDPVLATAAVELDALLRQVHPRDRFPVQATVPAAGDAIVLAVAADLPAGGFRIVHGRADGRTLGRIEGATPNAVLDGVYAVLERAHGLGFYLSRTTTGAAAAGPFSFAGWDLADHPLVAERGVMAWPNFLSGCSTWTRAAWLDWVRQCARLRATHVLLHTYANDPGLGFVHRTVAKPVGWINSSRTGRTYAVEHLLDVRTIPGAQGLFDTAWFACEAAQVDDAERVAAAQALYRDVFAEAHRFGLRTVWAIDVDTYEAHPQEMLAAVLGPDAVLASRRGKGWKLVRPDAPDGRAFHRAQLAAITGAIPAIDRLVVWVRAPGMSPAMDLALSDLPEAWRAADAPRLAGVAEAASPKTPVAGIAFAARVAEAWRAELDALGRSDIEVASGSWTWAFDKFAVADALLPPGMRIYLKDYGDTLHGKPQQFAALGRSRPIVPIAYAHHDDGHQCGPPLRLPENHLAQVRAAHVDGIAAVIWLTRPLDGYFRSAWDRVWASGERLAQAQVWERMAIDWCGRAAAAPMARFLAAWMAQAPTFGRETGDKFAPLQRARNQGLEDRDELAGADQARKAAEVAAAVATRGAHLDEAERLADTPEARGRIAYFRHYEAWTQGCFAAQAARAAGTGLDERPEVAVVAAFARAALADAPATAGERGQVVSLATRWQTCFTEARQRARREPVRLRMWPTRHDPIARKPGTFTFACDASGGFWLCLGEAETGHAARCRDGLAIADGWISAPNRLDVVATTVRGTPLAAGPYALTVHLPVHLGARRLRIEADGRDLGKVDAAAHGGVHALAGTVAPDAKGALRIAVVAVDGGEAVLSGLVLEPR